MENHFNKSILCKSKAVNNVEEERVFENVGALFLGAVKDEVENNDFEIDMPVQNGNIKFKVDTGADVTVISEEDLHTMGLRNKDIHKTKKTLTGPCKQKLACLGYIVHKFTWGAVTSSQICYVCKNLNKSLLGKPAIKDLDILNIKTQKEFICNAVKSTKNDNLNSKIIQEFPKVFQGLGCIKGDPIHVEIKEGTTPYHLSAPRHIALPLLEKTEKEIQRMEELGVIKKVDEPTDWCHPIVLVEKPNGDLRICIDLTKLNLGIKREFYQLESVEETLAKVGNHCNYMSKLDANSGYWQMPLDEESQIKATFITPFGRYCPTRGPFGMSSMQEIFNKKMDFVISGLKGVVKSTDDFLVFGSTLQEHDINLKALLQRFQDNNVTLNTEKCKFRQSEITFLGHIITKEGITPMTSRIKAITDFEPPSDITGLRRFMGMSQQLSKFSEEMSRAAEPLRDLLSSKNQWLWTTVHHQAFENVKKELSQPPVLVHFDITKEAKVRCDASKLNGLGIHLCQKHGDEWKTIACNSRFLSSAEKNYHPIELEMLGATWACEKFNMYLHGLPHFIIQTDHKPLIPILNSKDIPSMSPRIQRLRMRLLKYTFEAKWEKGSLLTDVDAFSRAPTERPTKEDEMAEQEVECHIATVIKQIPASEERLQEIRRKTIEDKTMIKLIKHIKEGWPPTKNECSEEIKPFWDARQDLTEIKGLILNGSRIVIPTQMRKEMIKRIHTGHQGMEKCKRRARQSCYWPNINKHIENAVKGCKTCAEMLPSKSREPLEPHAVPMKSWQKIGTDLFTTGNKNYLVVTDYYSLWPEVYLLNTTLAKDIVEATKDAFSRHGIPEEVVSDNGSQYKGRVYKQFASTWQFKHTTSGPRHPKSNGLAESSVKIVKKLVKKCNRSGGDILEGLLIIRNTPLSCGKSPAQLLMGRELRDNLPRIQKNEAQNQRVIQYWQTERHRRNTTIRGSIGNHRQQTLQPVKK